eukprot:TRINITY_DN85004_c0_g1_i1.p1 TRINITY_DN85004_c0_g1~~TRINITY_DN85004_c0_g1_i1.p1  ORF type:complete len:698 (+),score=25.93 TRINITY_DN85004_c0_g1_i1:28-2121(+)
MSFVYSTTSSNSDDWEFLEGGATLLHLPSVSIDLLADFLGIEESLRLRHTCKGFYGKLPFSTPTLTFTNWNELPRFLPKKKNILASLSSSLSFSSFFTPPSPMSSMSKEPEEKSFTYKVRSLRVRHSPPGAPITGLDEPPLHYLHVLLTLMDKELLTEFEVHFGPMKTSDLLTFPALPNLHTLTVHMENSWTAADVIQELVDNTRNLRHLTLHLPRFLANSLAKIPTIPVSVLTVELNCLLDVKQFTTALTLEQPDDDPTNQSWCDSCNTAALKPQTAGMAIRPHSHSTSSSAGCSHSQPSSYQQSPPERTPSLPSEGEQKNEDENETGEQQEGEGTFLNSLQPYRSDITFFGPGLGKTGPKSLNHEDARLHGYGGWRMKKDSNSTSTSDKHPPHGEFGSSECLEDGDSELWDMLTSSMSSAATGQPKGGPAGKHYRAHHCMTTLNLQLHHNQMNGSQCAVLLFCLMTKLPHLRELSLNLAHNQLDKGAKYAEYLLPQPGERRWSQMQKLHLNFSDNNSWSNAELIRTTVLHVRHTLQELSLRLSHNSALESASVGRLLLELRNFTALRKFSLDMSHTGIFWNSETLPGTTWLPEGVEIVELELGCSTAAGGATSTASLQLMTYDWPSTIREMRIDLNSNQFGEDVVTDELLPVLVKLKQLQVLTLGLQGNYIGAEMAETVRGSFAEGVKVDVDATN